MKEKIKNEILKLVTGRAPNFVRGEIIIRRLGEKFDSADITTAIEELVAEEKLKPPLIPKEWETAGAPFRGYALPSYKDIDIRRTIQVGDTSVARILSTESVQLSVEDINEAIETLSENFASLRNQYSEQLREEMRKQWGNLIAIFGIFVAIFSLIIVALPRINFPASCGFWDIVSSGFAQVVPVAVVLAVFIVVLLKLLR